MYRDREGLVDEKPTHQLSDLWGGAKVIYVRTIHGSDGIWEEFCFPSVSPAKRIRFPVGTVKRLLPDFKPGYYLVGRKSRSSSCCEPAIVRFDGTIFEVFFEGSTDLFPGTGISVERLVAQYAESIEPLAVVPALPITSFPVVLDGVTIERPVEGLGYVKVTVDGQEHTLSSAFAVKVGRALTAAGNIAKK